MYKPYGMSIPCHIALPHYNFSFKKVICGKMLLFMLVVQKQTQQEKRLNNVQEVNRCSSRPQ